MKRKASVSHDEAIIRRLRKDPYFAAEYLKAALGDEDEPRVLLIALRHLAQAQGMAKVAKAAGIERESLYRALSVHGNPRLSTLVAVTKAIGLRLTVEAAHSVGLQTSGEPRPHRNGRSTEGRWRFNAFGLGRHQELPLKVVSNPEHVQQQSKDPNGTCQNLSILERSKNQ